MANQALPTIIIVGGGAGGLELAARLGRKLGKAKLAQIILVDTHLTHLWKPLWHEVAAGTLNSQEDELNYVWFAYNQNFSFVLGQFDGINRAKREITLAPVLDENGQEIMPRRTLQYTALVIAVGSISNDFATPGVQEHCLFLDDQDQAKKFQQLFLEKIMHGQELKIAIVGGGATGVELAAELHYAIHQAVLYGLNKIDPQQDIKISVIEAADRILAALPEKLSVAIEHELQTMQIEVLAKQRVVSVSAAGLQTDKDLFIPANIKVWAAGIKAADFLRELDGLEVNAFNQLVVKQTLQTTRDEHIFAFGDCASCPQPNNKTVPPRAQAAHQQASLLVKSLSHYLQNEPLSLYYYRDYGSLISLSRQGTVGNLMGRLTGSVMLEGKLARLFYLSLYKLHQVALHGAWRVGLQSVAEFLTRKLHPRLKLH